MGKVDAFSIGGLELMFYSSDHLPPHFHARKPGEWEIRVYFLTTTEDVLDFDVKWPPAFDDPRSGTRKELRTEVVNSRDKLLEEWEAKVNYPE